MSTPHDYDTSPERYRTGMRVAREHGGADLYAAIAGHLGAHGARRVLDLGCGEGVLGSHVDDGVRLVSVDRSGTMLQRVAGPAVQADAVALPFPDGTFDAVVAVNVVDHVSRPPLALAEAHRVLRPGGLLVAGCISRHDSPELAHVWAPARTPFDAEDAPAVVREVFGDVLAEPWDAPLVRLPDAVAVTDYLVARFVPRDDAAALATRVDTPLWITKRGALVFGYR